MNYLLVKFQEYLGLSYGELYKYEINVGFESFDDEY